MDALRKQPELGKFQFRAENQWQGGTHNQTQLSDFDGVGEQLQHPQTFRFENDEPQILLGDDQAPNPVEWILHALLGCVTTTTVCHSAARGIEIESLESHVEGDIDIRGFLGLDESVPKGYSEIRVTLKVKTDAEAQKLKELAQYSPVYNTLTNPPRVVINVEKAD